jgi:hypothetical protein
MIEPGRQNVEFDEGKSEFKVNTQSCKPRLSLVNLD